MVDALGFKPVFRLSAKTADRKTGIWHIVRTCHSEPVLFPGVGISIEFWAIYRHPFVGAVSDRPPGRARTQVVTNLVYNCF